MQGDYNEGDVSAKRARELLRQFFNRYVLVSYFCKAELSVTLSSVGLGPELHDTILRIPLFVISSISNNILYDTI